MAVRAVVRTVKEERSTVRPVQKVVQRLPMDGIQRDAQAVTTARVRRNAVVLRIVRVVSRTAVLRQRAVGHKVQVPDGRR